MNQEQIEQIAQVAVTDADTLSKVYAKVFNQRLTNNMTAIRDKVLTNQISHTGMSMEAIDAVMGEYIPTTSMVIDVPVLDVKVREWLPEGKKKLFSGVEK